MLPYDRKNRLPFPLFEAVAGLWYAPDYLTIGNWSSKRIETLVSILLALLAVRTAPIPSSADAENPIAS